MGPPVQASSGGPTEILRLVMNYRTKTQWPRHLA